ncbi:MAG: hypothetical protein J7647_00050 [Cyanobacteria bacterium SBLK]|nr:hypothetical protein [Cyanobacteria bacterium SBLK]
MFETIKAKVLKNLDFYLFLIIILIVSWAYYPSLFHAPRADQILYLNCVKNLDGFKSLVLDTYALNRSCSGDVILFRPILYFLLGWEQWMFGYRFEYWQLTGIILHLLILLVFFSSLKFQPGFQQKRPEISWSQFLPFGVTLFFGLQSVSMEMIVWHHINGYLLFTFFLLAGILYLKYFTINKNYIFLGISFVLILLATFTYELGNVAALLIAGYLLILNISKPVNKLSFLNSLLFFLIPVIYIGLSLFDLHHRGYTNIPLPQVESSSDILQQDLSGFWFTTLIYYIVIYTIAWFMGGIIPNLYELRAGGRISFDIPLNFVPTFSSQSIVLIAIIICSIVAFLATRKINLYKLKQESLYLVFLLLLNLSYTGIIVYGRALKRGAHHIFVSNSYYSYISNILLLLFLYQFIILCTQSQHLQKIFKQFWNFYLIFVLSFLSILNGFHVYDINMQMVEFSRSSLVLFNRTLKTVQEHSQEPDFSFKAAEEEEECETNLVEVVFTEFYDRENAKYVISCKEKAPSPFP